MLEKSKRLVDLLRRAANRLNEDGHADPSDHYILMHGYLGAFTAVWNTLFDVEANADKNVGKALAVWKTIARPEFDLRGAKFRNRLVHAGSVPVPQWGLEWEESLDHDTVFPKPITTAVERFYGDGETTRLSLREWAMEAAWWWERQLPEVERIARSFERHMASAEAIGSPAGPNATGAESLRQ